VGHLSLFVIFGSVEMLKKINHNALGHSPTSRLPLIRLTRLQKGGQGDTPLGLPPPLGERGGHLRIFKSTKNEQNQVFYKAKSFKIPALPIKNSKEPKKYFPALYYPVISLFYTSRDFQAGFLSRPGLYTLRCGAGQRA
jgi:hypothetical protein